MIKIKDYIFSEVAEPLDLEKKEPPKKSGWGIIGNLFGGDETIKKKDSAKVPLAFKKSNEVFIDVIEKIVFKTNKSGWVVNSELIGKVLVKSFLRKEIPLRIKCDDALILDPESEASGPKLTNYLFKDSIHIKDFEVEKSFIVNCHLGEQEVLTYRVAHPISCPFKLHPFISEPNPNKLEICLKVISVTIFRFRLCSRILYLRGS